MFFLAYIFVNEKVLRIGFFIIIQRGYKIEGETKFKIPNKVVVNILITPFNLFYHPFNDFCHLSVVMMTYEGV